MMFVVLTRIFSKPSKPAGEVFLTTMTWATKDQRALAVRLRHQIFYNKQRQVFFLFFSFLFLSLVFLFRRRFKLIFLMYFYFFKCVFFPIQPKWYFVAVETVLDDDVPQPQPCLSDILHNPGELQRFKSQFSAFFNSLYTTKTITTTVTTISGPGPSPHSFLPPSLSSPSASRFSEFPQYAYPSSSSSSSTAYQHLRIASPSAYSHSSSSFDSSPDSYPLDSGSSPSSAAESGFSASASASGSGATGQPAWNNITLAELLEDDECRAILQEQKLKAAEKSQRALGQPDAAGVNNSPGPGHEAHYQSLEELLDEFAPGQAT
jgi:hypothetical protein